MLLPDPDVTTPEPEMPVAVELPLPETPVAPLVAAVRRVEAVKTVPLATVVAPVATTAVPLTVETADAVAVAVTAPLVPALIAAIEKMIVSGCCYGRGCCDQEGWGSPWQNAFPTLVISPVFVPDGHDSAAQSRTPKPKFMFVQRQVMLLLAQPRPGASASMLLMHVFCCLHIVVSRVVRS